MTPDADATALRVRLDAPPPDRIAVGRGTALFVCGTCFDERAAIESLWLLVDGEAQRTISHSMPRLDLFRSLHPALDPFATGALDADPASAEDPGMRSYLSGFWGIATIPPGAGPVCELALRAHLDDGVERTASLARISVSELARPAPVAEPCAGDGPLVAICMATHEPPPELFAAQVRSIRAQTHRNWVCVISDDCSSPDGVATVRATVGDDPRFVVSRSPRRLGFFSNFERALSLAPGNAALIALCDQDDRWDPDKLSELVSSIGDAQLVYSDARVIDSDGGVLADSYWVRRENNHTDLLSLLVANSITGAASLFRADLLDDVLPFPPAQFAHFHDHWIGLVARCAGEIRYLDRPLYDYVQHRGATLGHAAANRMSGLWERVAKLRSGPRERVRMWRFHYFVDAARLLQLTTVLELRLGDRMPRSKLRALRRLGDADSSTPALLRLWGRGARDLISSRPQTLGAEWMLAYAFTWRRLLAASARPRPVRGLRLDAVPPPDLVVSPGAAVADHPAVAEIERKLEPLRLTVADDAPERVNVLIPTIDLDHFFGGYIGKLNLAIKLAEAGLRVRVVTVDPVGPLPADWLGRIAGYAGLARIAERVEIAFGRESGGLEVSRRDRFVATTWWTAHIAHAALEQLAQPRQRGFLYLIQEYEPFTFEMGTYAALAAESYALEHTALFSTELLRDYFRGHRIGVYAPGGPGDSGAASFQNAITNVRAPTVAELAARTERRLLFYARPEAHASRNMFELGMMALARAVADGTLSGWRLRGIGTVAGQRRLSLGSGAWLELIPRSDQGAYGRMLREHDLGLALMYTPHPSLVPIEMASAGMVVVSNSFENKTEAALRRISPNLIAPAPTPTAIAAGLAAGAERAQDLDARIRGADVRWSRDWSTSLPDELVARAIQLLGTTAQ